MRFCMYLVCACMCLAIVFITLRMLPQLETPSTIAAHPVRPSKADPCEGRRVYMYDLPPSFHMELLAKCDRGLAKWIDFCAHWVNEGFGQRIELYPHWYATNNYLLEVIFHERMKSYLCRTPTPADAEAFFIPYYGGLEAIQYLYGEKTHLRNIQGISLLHWLKENATETWGRFGGVDHFMVLGRTAWDFFRQNDTSWGTRLLQQPELANVTALVLEKMPWEDVQQAVPYPTSFHPPSETALREWMDKVYNTKRTALFAFVGAGRPGKPGDIRTQLIEQCNNTTSCKFTDCAGISCGKNPQVILSAFMHADFCLQPRGDTPTRRSAFDAMIAGCIPVFFHKDSAYTQYKWHLPKDPSTYSVLIDEQEIRDGLMVEKILRTFKQEEIVALRANVVALIPGLVYMNASSPHGDLKDAFDLSVEGVVNKVRAWKGEQRQCHNCFLVKLCAGVAFVGLLYLLKCCAKICSGKWSTMRLLR